MNPNSATDRNVSATTGGSSSELKNHICGTAISGRPSSVARSSPIRRTRTDAISPENRQAQIARLIWSPGRMMDSSTGSGGYTYSRLLSPGPLVARCPRFTTNCRTGLTNPRSCAATARNSHGAASSSASAPCLLKRLAWPRNVSCDWSSRGWRGSSRGVRGRGRSGNCRGGF